MQLGNAVPGDTEEYFSNIPFAKVFHEGNTGGDRSIRDHRCAEVLAESPLPLANTLQWVYCRTAAERDTLLHMLGEKQASWAQRIQISNDLQLFERDFTFVDSVFLTANGVNFQLNPRRDLKNIALAVKVWNAKNEQIVNFANPDVAAKPTDGNYKGWRIEAPFSNGTYLVRLELEGHLAFEAYLSLGQNIV